MALTFSIDTAPALEAMERVRRLAETKPDVRELAEYSDAFTASVEILSPVSAPDHLCLVIGPSRHFSDALTRAETAASTERRIAVLEQQIAELRNRDNPR